MRRKLSEIIKEMACVVLKDPARQPSAEAASAALLIAHLAWNRAIDAGPSRVPSELLRQFEASNRLLWQELKSDNPEALISELVAYKQLYYPADRRHLIVCGMVGDKVHVEWTEPTTN
jgi:hypothetical protein